MKYNINTLLDIYKNDWMSIHKEDINKVFDEITFLIETKQTKSIIRVFNALTVISYIRELFGDLITINKLEDLVHSKIEIILNVSFINIPDHTLIEFDQAIQKHKNKR